MLNVTHRRCIATVTYVECPMPDMRTAWRSFRKVTNYMAPDEFWEFLGIKDSRAIYHTSFDGYRLTPEQATIIKILLSPHAYTLLRAHAIKHGKRWPEKSHDHK